MWRGSAMDGFSLGDLVTAIGLAFVIEGLVFIAFPDAAKRMLASVAASPANQLRVAGLVSAAIGLGVVWLARL